MKRSDLTEKILDIKRAKVGRLAVMEVKGSRLPVLGTIQRQGIAVSQVVPFWHDAPLTTSEVLSATPVVWMRLA